ncbi:hypothetical protein [Parablautia muri]|uniref:Uncharacterized protein n=1 Tax=Parablautia muri TaxID=2320879 RepID=A0A9X5BG74_9FIRM|nr:hypothetical protein [Parablautia muri]NBJ93275.1 hypothetical protein [Parablautia muri]
MKKNEIAHYPEITRFIEAQLQSNFRAEGINDIDIFWKNGELTSGLKALIQEHPAECACLVKYSEITPSLNLDIFGVVTNGIQYEIVILEIKLRTAVGLSEWSQLIGYNLVSDAKYGLLINIDAGASDRLARILSFDEDISRIVRKRKNGAAIEHLLGFMQWNSVTQNFEYSNLGQISSLSLLSTILIEQFRSRLEQENNNS